MSDYDPGLKVIVPKDKKVFTGGKFIIAHAVLVAVDGLTEYEQGISITKAHQLEDDPWMEFFVESFRQYDHGRSALEVVDNL